MKITAFTLAALATTVSVASALANPVDESMIVTATRMETPVSRVLAPVSVITADDIERLQLGNMSDLLGRMTSVESLTSGGPGSVTSVYVRGGNTDHTLILVDGVRISSGTNGGSAIELLDMDNIERVELVRGPASSQYGADAISGVINIITRQQQDNALVVRGEYGSQDWNRLQARLSGSSDSTRWSVSAAQETLQGFDRRELDTFLNGDDDLYRNTQLSANLVHDWTSTLKTRLNYQLSKGKSELDNACRLPDYSETPCRPFTENRQEVLNLTTDWQATEALALKAQVARSVDGSQNGDDVVTPQQIEGSDNFFKTTRDTYLLQGAYRFNEYLTAVVGSEYYDDRIRTSGDYLQDSRDNLAVFAQLEAGLGRHQWQLGLRNDDNEAFGSETTRSLSWGYQLHETTRLIASWGTAFRAPTFNDLYWPADAFGVGNPALSPEESENAELALKWHSGGHSLSGAVFRNRIDGLINWAPVDTNNFYGQWTPTNLDDVRIEGFELNYGYRQGGWSVNANYTWVDAEDLATEERLVRRARRLFNVDVDYTFSQLTLGFSVKARSDRTTGSSATPELPGYGLLDLRASYQLTPELLFDATFSNVLDKDYQQHLGYNEEQRGFRVGFVYRL